MNKNHFNQVCDNIIHHTITREGIGTLQEKTLHAVLKHYYEPDPAYHEQRIKTYVADIAKNDSVVEIQTGNFNALRDKLSAFLPEYHVTIAYPIPHIKWLRWLNEETGEISPRRKSPKTGSPYMAFRELYRIKSFLSHPNLQLDLLLVDLEECRLLNGWSKDKKRGSRRYERIPVALHDVIHIRKRSDYREMLPPELTASFDSKDYSRHSRLSLSQARTALNILYYLGLVKRVGKRGNTYLYEKEDAGLL